MITRRCFVIFFVVILTASLGTLRTDAANCLWKVSSENGGVLYIQGSVHVLKAENHPLAPAIEAAYAESSELVLEVDMAEMTSPETQQLLLGKGMLQQPDTLKSVLDPETYLKLEAAAAEAGLPMLAIQQFKPWLASITLVMVKMQKMGLHPQYGLDTHFFTKAKSDGKPVIGLETVDFQINLFDNLANQNPNDFINRSLSDLDLMEKEIGQILDAWKTGDIASLEKLLLKSFAEYPELYGKFITARNIAWAEKLTKMLQEKKTVMVVVGAGHLPGEKGLINLLEQKGFAIEQL